MKKSSGSLLSLAIMVTLIGCSGGGGGGTSGGSNSGAFSFSGFHGQAQKGPLIFGSEITVYELDSNLQETGRSFDAQTTDDLGNFAVRGQFNTSLVKMIGVGYYMDELTGGLSAAPVTLSAIADLSVDSTPTINILTTLATPRTIALMQSGSTYSSAISQSSREVLAVFGIDSSKINGLQALYAMSINGSYDQDAALLAASSVLSQMATTAATVGSSQAAQLSYFLSRIASDVANYGALNSPAIQTALNSAETHVNLNQIRTNVQTYYANRGVNMTAPRFEEWIDTSGSGVLPQRLSQIAGVSIANISNVDALQSILSSAMRVSISTQGEVDRLYVDANTTAVVNGNIVPSQYSTVQDGDILQLQRTSDVFGRSFTSRFSVGGSASTWSVSTVMPTMQYVSPGSCVGGVGVNRATTQTFLAIPFIPQHDFSAKYIAIGMNNSISPISISIYSSSWNGSEQEPNTTAAPLVTTSNIGSYFDQGVGFNLSGTVGSYSGVSLTNVLGNSQYLLSSNAVSLSAHTIYWVVITESNANQYYIASDSLRPADLVLPGPQQAGTVPKSSANGTTWQGAALVSNCGAGIPTVWLTD